MTPSLCQESHRRGVRGLLTVSRDAAAAPGEAEKLTTETDTFELALRELEIAASPFLPLTAMGPAGYAEKHASFEARSDQRALISSWLVGFAASLPRPARPFRVLSIGCGDGSVDVALAATLAADGSVDYRGVEPHEPSAQRFLDRLEKIANVHVSTEISDFAAIPRGAPCDLVIAVHSLYYVPDLRDALAAAHAMLSPGGRLVVVHAPRERLNSLVGILAPGRTQEFADGVERALEALCLPFDRHRIDAVLDLSRRGVSGQGEWRNILDFTVQAVIPDELLDPVDDALMAAALFPAAGPGDLIVGHPVDVYVIPGPVISVPSAA